MARIDKGFKFTYYFAATYFHRTDFCYGSAKMRCPTCGFKVYYYEGCFLQRLTELLQSALPRRIHRIVNHALTVDDCYDIAGVILSGTWA
jgi:hypothetical protein